MHHVLSGEHCYSWLSKCRGLMFARAPKTLFFHFSTPTIIRLHMFFVLFPIDVILLNSKNRIVELNENLLPWSFFTGMNKAVCVIECAMGTVNRLRMRKGDTVEMQKLSES